MKRLFALTLLLCVSAFGSVAIVQSQDASGTSTTSSVTLATTPVSGNLLVAFVTLPYSSVTTAPTGYTLIQGGSVNIPLYLYYKVAGASEPKTITASLSGSVGWLTGVIEFSGLTGSPFDQYATSGSNSSPVSSGTTPTTSQAKELVVAVLSAATTGSLGSMTNGFTQLWSNIGLNPFVSVGTLVVSSTGTYSTSATLSIADPNHGTVATFLIGGATATMTPIIM